MASAHFAPAGRRDVITREGLLFRASRPPGARLLVFAAPPGSGRSTAMSQLVRHEAGERTAVWVAVSSDDAGRVPFWRRTVRALVDAGLGPHAPTLRNLHAGGVLAENDLTHLARAFSELGDAVLALDDLDLAGADALVPDIMAVLSAAPRLRLRVALREGTALVAAAATRGIATRVFTERDLLLSAAETLEVVRAHARGSRTRLEPLAAIVHERSGGWPLAVHTLVSSSGTEPVADLAPSRRPALVTGYVDRMLASATEEARRVLLACSVVDEVSAELAGRLSGMPTEAAARHLSAPAAPAGQVWRDAAGTQWFRMHELIRAELRERASALLGPERLRDLHRIVTDAVADRRPLLAVRAAFDAQEWERAEDLIVARYSAYLHSPDPGVARRLREVPAAVRERLPALRSLSLQHGHTRTHPSGERVVSTFRTLTGRELLREAERDGMPAAVAAALRMTAARSAGLPGLSRRMALRAHEATLGLPAEDARRYEQALSAVRTQTALTHLHLEDYASADELIAPLRHERSTAAHPERAHAIALSALASAWRGRLHDAAAWIARSERTELPVGWHDAHVGAGYRIAKALLLLEGDHALAVREHLSVLDRQEGLSDLWPYLTLVAAAAVERESGPGPALEVLERSRERHRNAPAPLPPLRAVLDAGRARLLWCKGRRADPALTRGGGMSGVYTACARAAWPEAAARAEEVLSQSAASPRRQATALLLRAHALTGAGEEDTALDSAVRAQRLMEDHSLRSPARALPRDALGRLSEIADAQGVRLSDVLDPDLGWRAA